MMCSAVATLVAMLVVMGGMMVTGQYGLDSGTLVDAATILMLGAAAFLALKDRAPNLQGLLICVSIPINLMAMLLIDGNGAWLALLLLSLTPVMWGLFAPLPACLAYTASLVVFFNFYLSPDHGMEVLFNGADQTGLSAVTLSVMAVAGMLAAVLPRQLVGAAYRALNKAVVQENMQRERLAQYAQMSSDWHMEVNEKGIIIDFFGTGEAVGSYWRDVLHDWEAETGAMAFTTAIQTREAFSNVRGTMQLGGVARKVECSGTPLFREDGSFAGYRSIAHDITERVEADAQLQRLATTDRLTGLENRHAFNEAIETLQARPGHLRVSVFYVDLDKFKELNDRHGHGCGDTVLTELGERFARLIDEIPTLRVFRLGGDEFCCLLEISCGPLQTRELAGKIKRLINVPIEFEDRVIDLTASIGAACTDIKTDLDAALEQADAAVYEAKSYGGGHAIVPEGDVRERLERRINIQRDFTAAIANGEIRLQYQPIFGVKSRDLVGVEALARWTHPKFGAIGPSEFIHIAEASRDIIALGQHILRQSCLETLDWMNETSTSVRLNVNVSPNEMLAYGFVDSLFDTLADTGFPAHLLEVEITERGVLQNIEASRDVIREIRHRGATVALDDFGTGHSSLSRLESLPVDRIKVDRSFFVRAQQSDRARQILGILAGMSRILNVDVIAEGIENEEQMRFVEFAGFAKVQGYLLGRPGPLSALHPAGKIPRSEGDKLAGV
ncbi:putative bifunctional diguanylate cyclase/phosphodiesterase [Henriciella aquimarina]|uniref:putative bifunctional diguanylate cyclase/phosphodiesterase n=1 Tax=Henriciella aquimarina TaxID=545261 RepID=UPI001301C7D9|nr:bifunctional diguanylate cyclase/phosphodiesterase [Henriciella aquimarina]